MCLKSINAESQEGMFGQCHRIAERTTNRHPDNIITQIMIRTQRKHPIYKKTRCSNSIVRKQPQGYLTLVALPSHLNYQTSTRTAGKLTFNGSDPFWFMEEMSGGVQLRKLMYSRMATVILNFSLTFFTFVKQTFPKCMTNSTNAGRQ